MNEELSKVPVTVCIAMSEAGTFLTAVVDSHWIQEEQRYQRLMKRVREDKQLWSVKYIRTGINYPTQTENQS